MTEGKLYTCKLTLPANASFQTLIGPVAGSSRASKQLVCLDACKKLHQMGALNDSLLPCNKVSPQKGSTLKVKAVASVAISGAGKYIQVRLHGVIYVQNSCIVLGICPNS